MVTFCFSGHRPDKLGGYQISNPKLTAIYSYFKQHFIATLPKSIEVHVLVGMALGFDLLMAELMVELKDLGYNITLEACIPFRSHCPSNRYKDEWTALYYSVLERSDIITYVDEVDGYYETSVMQGSYSKEKLMLRNRYMADKSQFAIVLFEDSGYGGGTYSFIKYAQGISLKTQIFTPYSIYKEEGLHGFTS